MKFNRVLHPGCGKGLFCWHSPIADFLFNSDRRFGVDSCVIVVSRHVLCDRTSPHEGPCDAPTMPCHTAEHRGVALRHIGDASAGAPTQYHPQPGQLPPKHERCKNDASKQSKPSTGHGWQPAGVETLLPSGGCRTRVRKRHARPSLASASYMHTRKTLVL
jgi:hypothetical protein